MHPTILEHLAECYHLTGATAKGIQLLQAHLEARKASAKAAHRTRLAFVRRKSRGEDGLDLQDTVPRILKATPYLVDVDLVHMLCDLLMAQSQYGEAMNLLVFVKQQFLPTPMPIAAQALTGAFHAVLAPVTQFPLELAVKLAACAIRDGQPHSEHVRQPIQALMQANVCWLVW